MVDIFELIRQDKGLYGTMPSNAPSTYARPYTAPVIPATSPSARNVRVYTPGQGNIWIPESQLTIPQPPEGAVTGPGPTYHPDIWEQIVWEPTNQTWVPWNELTPGAPFYAHTGVYGDWIPGWAKPYMREGMTIEEAAAAAQAEAEKQSRNSTPSSGGYLEYPSPVRWNQTRWVDPYNPGSRRWFPWLG